MSYKNKMKKILKKLSLIAAAFAASCAVSIGASAASFSVDKQNIILTVGQTISLNVAGDEDLELTVSSECASVAKATFDSDNNTVTIKSNGFGSAVITLRNTLDSSDYKYIRVQCTAASVTGIYGYFDSTQKYKYLETSDGTKATGWCNVNGKTVYFYPNGVMESYTGPIMSKNKLYFLQDGEYTGEVYDAYLFEIFNNNMPIAENAYDFYKESIARYGKSNVKVSLSSGSKEVVITVPSYMPGFPWGANGQYYFSNGEGIVPKGKIKLSGYEFSGKVFMTMNQSDDELYKSTQTASYVKKAMFDAFGKNCTTITSSSGTKIYRWEKIGKEKVSVDIMIKDSGILLEIYYP